MIKISLRGTAMNFFEKLSVKIKDKKKAKEAENRWLCKSCGQSNAMHRQACNDCGKDK